MTGVAYLIDTNCKGCEQMTMEIAGVDEGELGVFFLEDGGLGLAAHDKERAIYFELNDKEREVLKKFLCGELEQ